VRNSDRTGSSQGEHQAPISGDAGASLETVAKRRRRVFSAADELRILKGADSCLASGKQALGGRYCGGRALVARCCRRGERSSGLTGQRGCQESWAQAEAHRGERRVVVLTKRNAVLERKLHVANVLIGLQ